MHTDPRDYIAQTQYEESTEVVQSMSATTQDSVKAYLLDTLEDNIPRDVTHLIMNKTEDEIREAFKGAKVALDELYKRLEDVKYKGKIMGVELNQKVGKEKWGGGESIESTLRTLSSLPDEGEFSKMERMQAVAKEIAEVHRAVRAWEGTIQSRKAFLRTVRPESEWEKLGL